MTISNWRDILVGCPTATVEYASPQFSETSSVAMGDFLLVSFPSGVHLEVSWDDEEDKFVVRLSRNRFREVIAEERCTSGYYAIEKVKQFALFAELLESVGPASRCFSSTVQPSDQSIVSFVVETKIRPRNIASNNSDVARFYPPIRAKILQTHGAATNA